MKNILELKKSNFTFDEKDDFSELYKDRDYFNSRLYYTIRFKQVPNIIETKKVDCDRAFKWFSKKYADDIQDMGYQLVNDKKTPNPATIYCQLFEDFIISFYYGVSYIEIMYCNTDIAKVQEIVSQLKKFKKIKQKDKPEILLLVNSYGGLDTHNLEITKPKLSIDDNYNDDFKEIHQTILKRLQKQNDKGIVLLHGKPGTGKTNYIRYLASMLKKNVIFLPPNMAGAITNPELLSLLIDNPNSVFVIEDAENIVVDRERDGASPVSALLNLSDGLLSDCLNIQLVCSFNTDISKIDSALMRKGRLIAKYEFKELETEKAQALSDKLNFTTKIDKPMTLSEIYNQEDMEFQNNERANAIGFKIVPKPKYKFGRRNLDLD